MPLYENSLYLHIEIFWELSPELNLLYIFSAVSLKDEEELISTSIGMVLVIPYCYKLLVLSGNIWL